MTSWITCFTGAHPLPTKFNINHNFMFTMYGPSKRQRWKAKQNTYEYKDAPSKLDLLWIYFFVFDPGAEKTFNMRNMPNPKHQTDKAGISLHWHNPLLLLLLCVLILARIATPNIHGICCSTIHLRICCNRWRTNHANPCVCLYLICNNKARRPPETTKCYDNKFQPRNT